MKREGELAFHVRLGDGDRIGEFEVSSFGPPDNPFLTIRATAHYPGSCSI